MVQASKMQREYLSNKKVQGKNNVSKEGRYDKRARVVVRYHPFLVTEDQVRTVFEKYGEISKVNLLNREINKKGFGFVQFNDIPNAAKAIHSLNETEWKGKKIKCKFALPKFRYEEWKVENEITKVEPQDEIQIEDGIINDVEMKEEEEDVEVEAEKDEYYDGTRTVNESAESDRDNHSDEKDDSETKDKVVETINNDGKTVFVENIPSDADTVLFRKSMLRFGCVRYAVINYDKVTGRSLCTGFVRFKSKETADKCLEAGAEVRLFNNILKFHSAMPSVEFETKRIEESRNLHLLKEGLIEANTKAAVGVSQSDMALRQRLEQHKSQILRSPNMYISLKRLVVHNLPPSWDNEKLCTLMAEHAGCSNDEIKETRIMRDMRNVDSKGVGRSKEYGFVTFNLHHYALTALRSLNNNPSVFSLNKRPIVCFSIENNVMVHAQVKEWIKSKQFNLVNENAKCDKTDNEVVKTDNNNECCGIESSPDVNEKMRTNHQLKSEAILHSTQDKLKKKRRKRPTKSRSQTRRIASGKSNNQKEIEMV